MFSNRQDIVKAWLHVTTICNKSFFNCLNLKEVTFYKVKEIIPNDGTAGNKGAFEDCINLLTINFIGDTLKKLGLSAFYNCQNIKEVIIPNSVTFIEGSVFERCSSISYVYIPNSVTSIGNAAFKKCSSISYVYIPDTCKTIGGSCFYLSTNIKSINSTEEGIFDLSNVTSYGDDSAVKGMIYMKELYTGGYGWNSFALCTNLMKVRFTNPKLTGIGFGCFNGCTSLTSIGLEGSEAAVELLNSFTYLNWLTFNGCTGLITVSLPENITLLGWNCFSNCTNLLEINIGSKLTKIEHDCFTNNINLLNINFNNTIEAWNNVNKGDNWKLNVPTTCIVHCTDGEISI